MKQYFAKYLLVSEDIKEGDKAIDENIHHPNNIVTLTFDKYGTASDGRGTYSKAGLKKLKKVKPFLCSRDIQIDDELTYMGGDWPGMGFYDGVSKMKCSNPKEVNPHKEVWFKVIGEISPEAVWVTENQEFTEEEIKRDIITEWYAGEDDYTEFQHHHPKGNEMFVLPSDEELIKELPIKILCSNCKTFH